MVETALEDDRRWSRRRGHRRLAGREAAEESMNRRTQLHIRLAHRIYRIEEWITNHYEKWPGPIYRWWDHVDDDALHQPLCGLLGHEAEKDQCNLPEHDQCQWCHKPMPFQAGDVPERMLKRLHFYLDSPTVSKMVEERLGENGLKLRERK